jgi:hypothetical protein
VKNIHFEKISGFWAPFSAAAITAAGDNFFNFFLHILIDYFFNYRTNVANFRGGSWAKIFFK